MSKPAQHSKPRPTRSAKPKSARSHKANSTRKKKAKSEETFADRLSNNSGRQQFLDALKYDRNGLVTVVAQDHWSNEVLMVAHASRPALEETLNSGYMYYFSRSRNKLWKKGESSGHMQKIISLLVDCDGDAIVARVKQIKGACHLGFRSCFAYQINRTGRMKVVGKMAFNPKKVYRTSDESSHKKRDHNSAR